MLLTFGVQMSSTPWTHYDWLFREPIQSTMTYGNYGRYDNPEVFDLVDDLDRTPIEDVAQMRAIISEIQRHQLRDMPIIPLWYNSLWAQYSNTIWTNWPSAAENDNHYLPSTWRGYWNMTGILMLTELESAAQ